jgi:predicted RecB family nuclease
MAPVTDVSGIGEERVRGLAQMGIRTVADLADADSSEIELTMVNVSLSMVRDWQAAARDLLGAEKEEVDYDD